MNKLFLFSLVALCLIGYLEANDKLVVCYVGTWAVYRPGNGKHEVADIDPFLCTHLMYGFFGINIEGTVKILDPYLDLEEDWGRGNIKKFNDLKKVNPKLKTIAAIGGWNEGSKKFSIVAASSSLRQHFAKDSAEFCRKHGFDGIDMDWEYPAQRDGDPVNDKANHVLLLKDIKEEFKKHNLLLMAAVASAEFSSGISYDIPKVSLYLDYINVMAYDLHGAWDKNVGLNSPLYAGPNDQSELEKQLNVNASINYWLSQGAPKEKIILGMPLYGRTFTLQSPSQTQIGAPANGPGAAGEFTREPGMIGYNELCKKLMTETWDMNYSQEQKAPFMSKGNQWIGYDDIASIELKTKYMLDMGLGGAMVWSLETDDFRGLCGSGKYPLMETINAVIGNKPTPPPQTTTTSGPTTPTTTTTRDPNLPTLPPGECTVSGIFPDPTACDKYYICDGTQKFDFTCPAPLLFNKVLLICDWPQNVTC